MPASTTELLTESACVIAQGASQTQAAELALLSRMRGIGSGGLTGAAPTPQSLMAEAACTTCMGVPQVAAAEIALLDRINQRYAPPLPQSNPMACAEGCLMWCNPSSYPPLLPDGSNIGIWHDSSGNGNDLTTVLHWGPTLRRNFYNGFSASDFSSASNEHYQSAPLATYFTGIDKPYTMFMAARVKALGVSNTFWACSDTSGSPPMARTIIAVASSMSHFRLTDDSTLTINHATLGGAQLVNFSLITERFDGATHQLWINAVRLWNLHGLTTGKQFTSDWSNFFIGLVPPGPPGTLPLNGYILDVSFFNRALPDDERECVMLRYYNSRYNLW